MHINEIKAKAHALTRLSGWPWQFLFARNLERFTCALTTVSSSKKTTKDAHLPLPDEVQDQLAGYIDDVLVHSSTEDLHRAAPEESLPVTEEAGLTLRRKKCHTGMPEVPYLGHVFSGTGMTPNQE